MLNESLLDDVEIDEVSDDNTSDTEYAFVINFNKNPELSKHFCQQLDEYMKNFSYVVNYSLHTDTMPELNYIKSFATVGVTISGTDKYDNFQATFIYILNSFLCFLLCNKLKNVFISVFNPSKVSFDNIIYIELNDDKKVVSIDVNKFYETEFNEFDFDKFTKSILPIFIKNKIVKPLDKNKTRYAVYFSNECRLYIFDNHIDVLNYIEVDNSKGKENGIKSIEGYDEYGMLRVNLKSADCTISDILDMNGKSIISSEKIIRSKQFSNGFAVVQRDFDKNCNYIDTSGGFLLSDWYFNAYSFSNGFALIETTYKGRYNIIDTKGEILLDDDYDKIIPYYEFEYFYIEKNSICNIFGFDRKFKKDWKWFTYCEPVSKRYVYVSYEDKIGDGFYDFYDLDEKKFLSEGCKYRSVQGWPDYGVYACLIKSKKSVPEKWYFKDIASGRILNNDGYFSLETIKDTDCKMYVVGNYDEKGNYFEYCVDATGKVLSDFGKSSDIKYHKNGLICLKIINGGMKIINADGVLLKEYAEKDSFYIFDNENHSSYWKVNRYSDRFNNHSEYNYIDSKGELVYKGMWFETVRPFEHGFSFVDDTEYTNNILTSAGELLWKTGEHMVFKIDVIEDEEYVIVKDQDYKSNVFDKDGNPVFKEWIDNDISMVCPGVLRVGENALLDYKGKFISCL